eukprot:2414898-Pleurochrysis_carterae.AAC.1
MFTRATSGSKRGRAELCTPRANSASGEKPLGPSLQYVTMYKKSKQDTSKWLHSSVLRIIVGVLANLVVKTSIPWEQTE